MVSTTRGLVLFAEQGLTVTDLSAAGAETISELARLVPMYEELASPSRIHLLQSLVSRLLVELVFDASFVGLPGEVAGQVRQVEAFLGTYSKTLSQTEPLVTIILMMKQHPQSP